jgi:DNA-binding transcriptional ArsR family regulator
LLIGGAGAGKTTFLQWFFRVNEQRPRLENTVLIWVDFREAGYATDEVAQRLRQEIISQLEDSPLLGLDSLGALQAVYSDRISRLRKTTLAPFEQDASQMQTKIAECINQWQSDAYEYLRRLLYYAIHHSGRSVLIVLDNADQKDEPFQYAVYDVAQQLANSESVSIVLVIRESTFFKASQSPRLNAFSQQQVFHIQAPRLGPVLSKRFSYLASSIRKQPFTITSAAGYTLTVDNVNQFLALLEKSILEGKESPRILELLETVSNGSVREALNLVYEFLVSGHTKMDMYFWEYAQGETSRIPYHEFLASVMLDEMAFFSENDSHTFVNLFARQPGPGDSHFSRLRILAMAEALSPGNTLRSEDYVPLEAIREPFVQCGMAQATVDRHLKSLVRFGLLIADTQAREEKEFKSVKSVHLTAAGRYYLDRLAGDFEYCSRVIPDTFIVDEKVYSQMVELYRFAFSNNFLLSLDRRLQVTEIFVRYLDSQEQAEHETGAIARSLHLGDRWFAERCAHPVLAEIERIKKLLGIRGTLF